MNQEGADGVVNLEFGESDDIKTMLGYLYTIDPVKDSKDVFIRFARLYIAVNASLRALPPSTLALSF